MGGGLQNATGMAKYRISEFPFWRDRALRIKVSAKILSTSDMVQEIQGFRDRYKQLPQDQRRWARESYGENIALGQYLFQVNKIEQEGFETYEETQEAISRGALKIDEVQADARLEAVRSLHRAFRLMYPAAAAEEDDRKFPQLSFQKIMEVHGELMRSTNRGIAAKLRREPHEVVYTGTVKGGVHVFMWPSEVQGALEKLVESANNELKELVMFDSSSNSVEELLKFGARLFFEFEYIHPFLDGNGRVGRIILASVLRSVMPFPNALFVESSKVEPPFVDKLDYYECFQRAQDEQAFQVLQREEQGTCFMVSQEDLAQCNRYPPADLAALVIEGVYVGWKRLFDALESYSSSCSPNPPA